MENVLALAERAKELRCLYAVDSILANRAQTPETVFRRIIEMIPSGWQHPDSTGARIEYLGRRFVGPGHSDVGRKQTRALSLVGVDVGTIEISVRDGAAEPDADDFLEEEDELLRRIAARISEFLDWKHSEMLGAQSPRTRNHWAWRQRFAEALTDSLDAGRFGVSHVFLGGSTARGDAGPGSDIDLYILCEGTATQRREVALWIEGWSLCLGQVALEQTGQPFPGGIVNVQWLESVPDARQQAELQELRLSRRTDRTTPS